ncbi:hypothetical protein CO051_07380 [Candidatus Roizmanbacteria bacterium CG_4_9_14_0_2_um_filter_39_13]|uniref:Uncharacterized protein n=1 Tax=Candidatus Roizmanbacteria bacterium CG_4_9_14_0_2_um_filter_39_13 TaxID=1974839 RepID=A0A2M8EW83_9BACT|nr:MAG: hypothetical protein CO051_07380 [Candidatus Roizmanbacteria bacterium CG_4_9_14_0_2_um_filter_39_13]
MNKILAQSLNFQVGPPPASGTPAQTVAIEGPLKGINSLADIVTIIMSFLYPFAGVILLFVFIWGGYDLLTSHGEPEKLNSGRAKITSGIIGFVLLAISYVLARVLGFIFGVGDGIL